VIAAVLFDLDDTLFDHQACTRSGLARLREAHACLRAWAVEDLAVHHSALLERLHLDVLAGRRTVDEARIERFATLFADAGERLTPDQAEAVAVEYRDAYIASWQLVPGALDLLAHLRGRVRLGVVTNNVVREQTRRMAALGLAPFFDTLVISEAVGVNKPDRRIFQYALDRLGCAAGVSVMVGDSWPTDIAGALRAGLHAVWFNRHRLPRPEGSAVPQIFSLEPAPAAADTILSSL
jgi:putative hydrolase of the HAD superfamily